MILIVAIDRRSLQLIRAHATARERYFAKGLESSATTLNKENGMPTVQNLSEVQRKCGVMGGGTKLDERESTMNRNKNSVEEEGQAPEGRWVVVPSF